LLAFGLFLLALAVRILGLRRKHPLPRRAVSWAPVEQ
jgi:hypothetical protein